MNIKYFWLDNILIKIIILVDLISYVVLYLGIVAFGLAFLLNFMGLRMYGFENGLSPLAIMLMAHMPYLLLTILKILMTIILCHGFIHFILSCWRCYSYLKLSNVGMGSFLSKIFCGSAQCSLNSFYVMEFWDG